jgi:simple sugar transport system permease protein
MPDATVVGNFLEASVRAGTPLAFAALGELIAERAGIVNIGLEGSLACGAFAAFVVAGSIGPEAGFLAGGLAGMSLGLLFAVFVIALRTQQIIAGAAVSMLGLGLSASLHRIAMTTSPGTDAQIHTLAPLPIPLLADLPVVGRALFAQPGTTYLLYVLFPVIGWVLYRTVAGLALRAVGEQPSAASSAGHSPKRIQFAALLICGFFSGLGGATLVVAQTGTFSDGMSAGRGFIAIAIVALGRWTPRGVAAGSLVFGAVSALQFLAQAMNWRIPYTIVLAAPYVLTLVAMAAVRGARVAPAALGKTLDRAY